MNNMTHDSAHRALSCVTICSLYVVVLLTYKYISIYIPRSDIKHVSMTNNSISSRAVLS